MMPFFQFHLLYLMTTLLPHMLGSTIGFAVAAAVKPRRPEPWCREYCSDGTYKHLQNEFCAADFVLKIKVRHKQENFDYAPSERIWRVQVLQTFRATGGASEMQSWSQHLQRRRSWRTKCKMARGRHAWSRQCQKWKQREKRRARSRNKRFRNCLNKRTTNKMLKCFIKLNYLKKQRRRRRRRNRRRNIRLYERERCKATDIEMRKGGIYLISGIMVGDKKYITNCGLIKAWPKKDSTKPVAPQHSGLLETAFLTKHQIAWLKSKQYNESCGHCKVEISLERRPSDMLLSQMSSGVFHKNNTCIWYTEDDSHKCGSLYELCEYTYDPIDMSHWLHREKRCIATSRTKYRNLDSQHTKCIESNFEQSQRNAS